MAVCVKIWGGGGGFQSVKIFRRFKFGMLRLTNWFVGDTNVMKYVSLKLKVP